MNIYAADSGSPTEHDLAVLASWAASPRRPLSRTRAPRSTRRAGPERRAGGLATATMTDPKETMNSTYDFGGRGRRRHRRQLRHEPRDRPIGVRRSGRRRRARRRQRPHAARRRGRADRRRSSGAPRLLRRVDEDQVAAVGERTVRPSAGWTRRSTTPASRSRRAAADEPTENFDRVNAGTCAVSGRARRTSWARCASRAAAPSSTALRSAASWDSPSSASYHASKHGVIGLPAAPHWDTRRPASASTPSAAARSRRRSSPRRSRKGDLNVPDVVANQPIGRLGRGDEIAAAVLWLCSPGARVVLGVALPVDSGYTARSVPGGGDYKTHLRWSPAGGSERPFGRR